MPVPSAITDLSQTAASNSPAGSESPVTVDNYLRQLSAFIAQLRDGQGLTAETDVASAATCDVGAANSLFVRVTGTTTITSLGANYNGPRFIRFAGALTLTHNASSLILPGGANIVTAAGDTCVATPISGGWVVSQYERASKAGTVLQEVTFALDAGGSTTSTALTGIATSKTITPKSTNSKIVVTCTCEVIQNVVSGVNPYVYLDLNIGGSYIGEERRIGAGSAAGGLASTVPVTIIGEYTNSALSAVGINVGVKVSTSSCTASVTAIKFTAREIQQ